MDIDEQRAEAIERFLALDTYQYVAKLVGRGYRPITSIYELRPWSCENGEREEHTVIVFFADRDYGFKSVVRAAPGTQGLPWNRIQMCHGRQLSIEDFDRFAAQGRVLNGHDSD